MKITERIKNELSDFNKLEIFVLIFTFVAITFNAIVLRDSFPAIISAICGILYTITAGKGKFYCYIIGLCGTACYSYIAFKNLLYGNCLLYLCYFAPLQIIGFFSWRKHLKERSCEIIKSKLSNKNLLICILILLLGITICYFILRYYNDSNPIIDAITTFSSFVAMYLTVKRCFEQWILWFIVNILSFIMWLNVALQGVNVYSTLVMWGVYTILAIYFAIMWQKEISEQKVS